MTQISQIEKRSTSAGLPNCVVRCIWIVAVGLFVLMVALASGCVRYRAYDSSQAVRTIKAGEAAAFDGVLVPNGTWLEMRRAIQERVRQQYEAPR